MPMPQGPVGSVEKAPSANLRGRDDPPAGGRREALDRKRLLDDAGSFALLIERAIERWDWVVPEIGAPNRKEALMFRQCPWAERAISFLFS